MKWHKSFQAQGVECRKAGNQFVIRFPGYTRVGIVCVPFKTYCHSKACFDMRFKKKETP